MLKVSFRPQPELTPERLSAWLKHLENRSGAAPDPNDPMATYDFTWM